MVQEIWKVTIIKVVDITRSSMLSLDAKLNKTPVGTLNLHLIEASKKNHATLTQEFLSLVFPGYHHHRRNTNVQC